MKVLVFTISAILFLGISTKAISQQVELKEDKYILQFTGVIITEDTELSVPGVHVYVPKGGRGTTSDVYGYFSMPVLNGDSLIISAVGFVKEHLIIPKNQKEDLTVIIRLEQDTTYLPEVEVYPFPSEQMFKEAILAFRLPSQYDNMNRNVDQAMLNKIYRGTAIGASGNYYYYSQTQTNTYNRRFQTNSISLLNPFAWNQFIKSLKRRKQEK
ncbi:carboxypeptidase-like regulatory domain-containing protein [Reichenbachiella versicolor]|uniref:carboxypeptidase-like regulatory domain-containing protein n=1 Tax=Reichenbachiella versicolor TaxID=1821036 RepID=UPI000D6DD211|nr:carboxypeptidase-like regulatory domain-containing protein [Reichenbachiella versicolor]